MKRYLKAAFFLSMGIHTGMAGVKPSTIGLIGDSTVAEQSGWGSAFASRFNVQAKVLNHAVNGATLESLSGKQVPFIDLHAISIAHHNAIGPEASMAYNFVEGDMTHFNRKGGEAIADLIIPELIKVAPELAPAVIERVAERSTPSKER